jgi:hypothetical protein
MVAGGGAVVLTVLFGELEDVMRVTSKNALVLCGALLVGAGVAAAADGFSFDFVGSTPVGSWQERQLTTTDDKGKETLTVTRVKYLGDETRGGEALAWIETELTNYTIKKDERKQQGEPISMKILMRKSLLEGDIANALGNLNDLATEVIMQVGDSRPMRIKGAGSMMAGVGQAIGLSVDYHLTPDGSESVTVPAGTFSCTRYRGQGSASAKVVVKTVHVESTATQWVSEEVPFGLVKLVSDDVVDGKKQHTEATLTAFGRSGATSKITGEPQDMPNLGSMLGGGS